MDEPYRVGMDSGGTGVEGLLRTVAPEFGRILERALAGSAISVGDATTLLQATGPAVFAIAGVADELRRRAVGDVVTYVVNRNINFTNVCIKRCGFCAFSRDFREEEGYFLPIEEVVRRAREAWELGATEVCIQAGLPPRMEGDLYLRICQAIRQEVPGLHIHGFSPEEVLYGALRSRLPVREYLQALKEAGVGSLPGTSAEILDDEVRARIAPGRIRTREWIEVIRTAHELGIPTTATMMYGHVETPAHQARHLDLIRSIQKETGGFTEFVPLSFVHTEAPMYRRQLVSGLRPGPDGLEVLKVHAVARIMLHDCLPNLQVSWVKEGPRMAQLLLGAGANDLGGTLLNESISTAAGSTSGQLMRPAQLRRLIRGAGRVPAERTTLYRIRRTFGAGEDSEEPLDRVEGLEQRLGSYFELVQDRRFRWSSAIRAQGR